MGILKLKSSHWIQSIKVSFVAVAVLVASLSSALAQDDSALMIIDMQADFIERSGSLKRSSNQKKLARLVEFQVATIRSAIESGIPIFLVEYRGYGPVLPEIMDSLRDYPNVIRVVKDRNGVFGGHSGFDQFIDKVEGLDVKTFYIMGANGGACVESSIEGALDQGYSVRALTSGIADFNYRRFIYPYRKRFPFPQGKGRPFRELTNVMDFDPRNEREHRAFCIWTSVASWFRGAR